MAHLLEDIYAMKFMCGKKGGWGGWSMNKNKNNLVLIPSKSKGSQVKSYCKVLRGGESFSWQSIWKVKAPPRVA